GRGVGEEAAEHRTGGAAEDLDVRPAAPAGPRDDVVAAVGVDVGAGDGRAAAEARVVGVELAEHGEGGAVPDADHRAAAGAGRRDQVGHAVVGQVGGDDADAAAEARLVGQEAAGQVAGAG